MSIPAPDLAAFKGYYTKTYTQKREERGTLIYDGKTWKMIKIDELKESIDPLFIETIKKVLSLEASRIPQRELFYWIDNFNSAMTINLLKHKKIQPIASAEGKIQFNSMNKYAWLSNFFVTLIYDPKFQMIYPSVESGYVAFKARKWNEEAQSASKVDALTYAHTLCPKTVKQQGVSLWERKTTQDDVEAVQEMERLVNLKFDQNSLIREFLKKSTGDLEEFTRDPFWGSALGTAENENSNQLGKIIERKRATLS